MAEGVPLGPEKLHWWSVHVQRFLRFVRKHPEQGPVEVLVEHFLADLDVQTPPIGAWQRDQVRQETGSGNEFRFWLPSFEGLHPRLDLG